LIGVEVVRRGGERMVGRQWHLVPFKVGAAARAVGGSGMGVHHMEEEVGGARPAIAGSGRPAPT
jgi:hypothetical protein